MALTAAPNERIKNFIIENLDMDNCTIVKGSNNKTNIFYSAQRLASYTANDVIKQEQVFEMAFGNTISDINNIFFVFQSLRAQIY